MRTKIFFILGLVLLLSSCKEQQDFDCQDLAFSMARGVPRASHNFLTYCSDAQIRITPDKCKKAEIDLLATGNADFAKKKYGDDVLKCFTEQQLKKLLPN